jgi:hypothetical protein
VNVSFRKRFIDKSSTARPLKDIISDIRSGVHKDVIEQIRLETDKSSRTELKKRLPLFFADVLFEDNASSLSSSKSFKTTGIIQFDIDDYDKEKSQKTLRLIKLNPSVLYSFLSPSGGIKFGVLTDFDCSHSTIKDKHSIAYSMVKNELSSDLLATIEVDDAVGSVSQQCYLSHDPDAYYNSSPEKLLINDRVDEIYEKQIVAQAKKDAEFVPTKTEEKDVRDALNSIPSIMSYHERLDTNFAVIDFFGDRAKSILLGHWNVEDKGKLKRDIESQIRSHKSNTGRKKTVATLFKTVRLHGWKGNSLIRSTDDAEIDQEITFYTPEESTEKLKEIIYEDFFKKGISKFVNVECGSGKTRTMYRILSDFLFENPAKKVAIFLKTHEMIGQFVSDMNDNI